MGLCKGFLRMWSSLGWGQCSKYSHPVGTHCYIYIYIYRFMCVGVCIYICICIYIYRKKERERERAREREREKERGREGRVREGKSERGGIMACSCDGPDECQDSLFLTKRGCKNHRSVA